MTSLSLDIAHSLPEIVLAIGALSSGMLLYGSSLIYGYAGTVSFTGIAAALQGDVSIGVIFGLVFVLAGLAFKMSIVPFHMWTPDVYEGAPTPVTTFFATAAKVAAVAITVRIIITAFPGVKPQWQQIIVFVSILSMALGAFGAIGQTNIKRLMAYSSIGHMGFALVGLSTGTEQGVAGVMIYMAIYVLMSLGAFAAILSMRIGDRYVENIGDLAGLARTNGFMAFVIAMMMFSLAGVLVEGSTLANAKFAVCIGFGVDCAHNPDGLAYPATNLAALGLFCPPELLLQGLVQSCDHWLGIWAGGAGFAAVRSHWLAHAANLGAPIRVGRADHVIEGVFETIDADGRLILATPSGRTALEAGDVFPSGAALTNG